MLITEPFQTLVADRAAALGAPGYHYLAVPHPIWGKDGEELRALARPLVDAALAQLTSGYAGAAAPSAARIAP